MLEVRYRRSRDAYLAFSPAYDKEHLDVFVTNEYTDRSAWAHTQPEKRTICIRPPEFLDYRLNVLNHEIEHNVNPGEHNEDLISKRGKDKSRDEVRYRFEIRYH